MTNYRDEYKKYYGIEFGNEYDIHHIDFDRNNNDIKNLILLPKKLHNDYHKLINILGIKCTMNFQINILDGQDYLYKNGKRLCVIMEKITFWKLAKLIRYKDINL